MQGEGRGNVGAVVLGLGDYGRRLIWLLEMEIQAAGLTGLVQCCLPDREGNLDAAALPDAPPDLMLLVADWGERGSLARLYQTAQCLQARGWPAWALLAAPAGVSRAGQLPAGLVDYLWLESATADEWRANRALLLKALAAALPQPALAWEQLACVLPQTGAQGHALQPVTTMQAA